MRLIRRSSPDGRVGSCNRRIIGRTGIDVQCGLLRSSPVRPGPARPSAGGVQDSDGGRPLVGRTDRRTVQRLIRLRLFSDRSDGGLMSLLNGTSTVIQRPLNHSISPPPYCMRLHSRCILSETVSDFVYCPDPPLPYSYKN